MNKDILKAERMFKDYGCSHFFMTRDGVLEEYLSLGIDTGMEMKWIKECYFEKVKLFSEMFDNRSFIKIADFIILGKMFNRIDEALTLLIKSRDATDKTIYFNNYNIFCDLIDRAENLGCDVHKYRETLESIIP